MKKTYQSPITELLQANTEHQLLAGSPVGVRVGEQISGTMVYSDDDTEFIDAEDDRMDFDENLWW